MQNKKTKKYMCGLCNAKRQKNIDLCNLQLKYKKYIKLCIVMDNIISKLLA